MELLVVVFYAAILALVAPLVLPKRDQFGNLVPAGIAAVAGGALWLILTWLGFQYDEAWIWVTVMLGMPAAVWFGSIYLANSRQKQEETELAALRARGRI